MDLVTPKPDEDIEVIGRLIEEFGKMPLELERVEKAPKTFRIPKAHIEAMRYIDTYRGLLGDKRLFTDKVVSLIHRTITDELPVIQKKLDERPITPPQTPPSGVQNRREHVNGQWFP